MSLLAHKISGKSDKPFSSYRPRSSAEHCDFKTEPNCSVRPCSVRPKPNMFGVRSIPSGPLAKWIINTSLKNDSCFIQ